jgi:phosphoglycolate phosphatase
MAAILAEQATYCNTLLAEFSSYFHGRGFTRPNEAYTINCSNMNLNTLIFDFDGTLAELNLDFADLSAKIEAMARQEGLQGPWPEGFLLEALDELANRLGREYWRRAMAYLQEKEVEAARRGRLFPFSRGLLAEARQRGLAVGIISRNCGPAIREVFPQVDRECDVFLPREAVSRTKPDPAHILAAVERLGASPQGSVVIGDHWMDVRTGLEAGCLAVGVASGRISSQELAQAGAHLVLPDAGDLLKQLEAFGARLGRMAQPA